MLEYFCSKFLLEDLRNLFFLTDISGIKIISTLLLDTWAAKTSVCPFSLSVQSFEYVISKTYTEVVV